MDKQQIRKEIKALINSIKEHSDNIGDVDHVPQVELELILHKIEKLYQKSIVFNHLHTIQETPVAEKPVVKEIAVEPVKEEAPKVQEKPVDLFGTEITPSAEKPKAEKKVEKKEEKPVVVPPKQEEKKPEPVITKIHRPAISDIRSAIGINDKFQFANELFAGVMQEYEIAIQQLNTAETMESASEYFMSLQQLYNWNSDNETVKRLFDLVERRYGV